MIHKITKVIFVCFFHKITKVIFEKSKVLDMNFDITVEQF